MSEEPRAREKCGAVKREEIVDDERLKAEELGGGGNYSRGSSSTEDTEGERECPGNISRRSKENKDSSQSALSERF